MNNKRYVVVAVYELCEGIRTDLIGVYYTWTAAFRALKEQDYMMVLNQELIGTWVEEEYTSIHIDVEPNGRPSYNECHYAHCVDGETDPEYGASVMFHIFES